MNTKERFEWIKGRIRAVYTALAPPEDGTALTHTMNVLMVLGAVEQTARRIGAEFGVPDDMMDEARAEGMKVGDAMHADFKRNEPAIAVLVAAAGPAKPGECDCVLCAVKRTLATLGINAPDPHAGEVNVPPPKNGTVQ